MAGQLSAAKLNAGCAFQMKDLFVQDRLKLLAQLKKEGIRNPQVLEAIRTVPRHLFLDKEFEQDAYANCPLPIGQGQTISQPGIVAYMTELILAGGHFPEKCLEIGTGCGYQAAILAKVCAGVYTVERIRELQDQAIRRLQQLGFYNIHFHCGDGSQGWRQFAPFDAIVVTAAARQVPPGLVAQLAVGGRMVIPIGNKKRQDLVLLERKQTETTQQTMRAVKFVPLI